MSHCARLAGAFCGTGDFRYSAGKLSIAESIDFESGGLPKLNEDNVNFADVHFGFHLAQIGDGHDFGSGHQSGADDALARIAAGTSGSAETTRNSRFGTNTKSASPGMPLLKPNERNRIEGSAPLHSPVAEGRGRKRFQALRPCDQAGSADGE